jgi:hydrogenase assembly chaperone HypC/HupF
MCLAAPGRVTKIEGRKATVSYGDQSRPVMVGEEKVKVGDYVLVQMGIITQVLDKKEAKLRLKAFL